MDLSSDSLGCLHLVDLHHLSALKFTKKKIVVVGEMAVFRASREDDMPYLDSIMLQEMHASSMDVSQDPSAFLTSWQIINVLLALRFI